MLTYFRLIVIKCMQLLVVHLMSSRCVHRGLRLVHRWVATQTQMYLFTLYTCAHTFKQKKKIALVLRGLST
jgi:hypothetical protein